MDSLRAKKFSSVSLGLLLSVGVVLPVYANDDPEILVPLINLLTDDASSESPPELVDTIFEDQFDGTALDLAKWHLPTGPESFIRRTQMRPPGQEPEVRNGSLWLQLDTYNASFDPNDPAQIPSFFGTEVRTNRLFAVGNGINIKFRARFSSPMSNGFVGGLFTFAIDNGKRDELDFELLTNDSNAGRNRVLTNVYVNDAIGGAGQPKFAALGRPLTNYNRYRIEWRRASVRWFVNDELVREERNRIPRLATRVHLNFWGPDESFRQAYAPGVRPVDTASSNRRYFFQIDAVVVERVRD